MIKGILKMVEKTDSHKDLQYDYDCQCRENARKQERILEQKRIIEELEKKIEELEQKLEASDKEYDRLLQSLSKEQMEVVLNDNVGEQKPSKSRSRQTKKI